MHTSTPRVVACVAAAVLSMCLSACQRPDPSDPAGPPGPSVAARGNTDATPSAARVSPAPAGSALELVGTLTVAGRGAKTGYTREQYGPAWADTDRNGCDTRNDILRRDLTDRTYRAGTHDCVVLSGQLAEPYTGQPVTFSKDRASAVQIDHVVALSDAWQKGAASWPYPRRLGFANDPLNLLAADGPANEAKGDADTASWLPPNKAFRCAYVARQVAVKSTYALTVTDAEREAMLRVLRTCPTLPPPTGINLLPVPGVPAAPDAPSVAPASRPAEPDYGTCAMVQAHGAGRYHRGEPAYGYYQDGDGDGVVCE